MKIFKNFSLAVWLRQLGNTFRRFPVAVALLVFLAGYLISMTHDMGYSEKWTFFCIFYPATGALLAVSLQLLTEDFRGRVAAIATQVAVHALWLAVSLYLTQIERFSLPQFIAVAATVASMVLSMFLACFYRKGEDIPFWNFAWNTISALLSGAIVGGLLTVGLDLFVQSLEWLFDLEINDRLFIDIPVVCMVLVAPLLAMSQIPRGKNKHDYEVVSFSGFIKGVAQYLFIPLLLLYVATLYVYAGKILFTWQLPVGWVSYLVSASMVGMVALLFITYPVQYEQGRSFFKGFTRWMPLAMVPLLALMTVAIGRRLSDYGITVSRLYVLVFNIWCYVVCIGLLLSRNKRIWWIPASFAVVLMLISVGPQSIPSITHRQLLSEARAAFNAAGITRFPLSDAQYSAWATAAGNQAVAASIDAKLDYLQRDYGYQSVSDLLGKDVITGIYSSAARDGEAKSNSKSEIISNNNLIVDLAVPQGYRKMYYVSFDNTDVISMDSSQVVLGISVPARRGVQEGVVSQRRQADFKFSIDVKLLVERDSGKNQQGDAEPLMLHEGDALLMINRYCYWDMSLDGDGILFIK